MERYEFTTLSSLLGKTEDRPKLSHSYNAKMLNLQFVKDEDGNIVAFSDEVRIYGVGDTKAEAIGDAISMLDDYYEELKDSKSILSDDLLNQYHLIQTMINE